MLGKSWDQIRLILGYVGTFWAILARAHVGPSWAILGSVLAFVLDLDIPVSLKFRLCKAFAKRNINTKSKHNFELCLDVLVVRFCFFL